MRIGVVVAARTGSTRLPGKALRSMAGLPMIVFLLRRILPARFPDRVVFATTDLKADDHLAEVVLQEGVAVFRGANRDVIERYVDVGDKFEFDYVVRITGDCPFVDYETLDFCLEKCRAWGGFDLASTKTCFPVGIDYEIYRHEKMKDLHLSERLSDEDREHLTKYFYDNRREYDVRQVTPLKKWVWTRDAFTVDTMKDYFFCSRIAEGFDTIHFSVEELIQKVSQNKCAA